MDLREHVESITSMLHTKATFTIRPSVAFFYLISPCFKDGSVRVVKPPPLIPLKHCIFHWLWAATHMDNSQDYTNMQMAKSFVEENNM